MKTYRYIAVLLVAVAGPALSALSAHADDYVDDVYYWDTPLKTQVASSANPDEDKAQKYTDTSADQDYQKTEIIFIEDSVTRHDATVVKAVIKRQ